MAAYRLPTVAPPPATARWNMLLAATPIHFGQSAAYALPAPQPAERVDSKTAVVVGAICGVSLYARNCYDFTLFLPWFAVGRGWISLASHIVFGEAREAGCRRLPALRNPLA